MKGIMDYVVTTVGALAGAAWMGVIFSDAVEKLVALNLVMLNG